MRLHELSDYAREVWEHDGGKRCHHCMEPIIYDVDSGYWIHAGFGKVDGRNGLFCSPEMWDGGKPRVYARPW